MTKTVKRVLAITLLVLAVLLVGCLIFTGNRLADYPKDFEDYKSVVYEGKDGTMVAFTENGAWYSVGENEMILLEITDYSEGVVTMEKKDTTYRFVTIDKQTIYDETTKSLLTRRGNDDDFT